MQLDGGIADSGYYQQHYSSRDWKFYSGIVALIIKRSSPGPILDLGAGCGYLLECASRWGLTGTGMDGSIEAIAMAKERCPTLDIRYQKLSENLPFPENSFQTVVLNQVIEHLEPVVAVNVLRESFRVLHQDGVILIAAPSKANKYEAKADPTHINMMSPKELKALLISCGFVQIRPFDYPLPLLGSNWIAQGIMYVIFKLMPFDWYSATSNATASKR